MSELAGESEIEPPARSARGAERGRALSGLRFGVNYTPSVGWFHSWLEPRWDSIRKDLDAIAELGLDHIRIFPLWPLLQPNRTLIRPRALADLRTTVELAAQAGLDTAVDVLQGHLSSFDFLPSWLSSWHARNMFTDPEVVTAQAALVQAVYDALADSPGLLALTLGNELNQFADRPHPSPMPATADQVTGWLDTLLGAVPADSPVPALHAAYDAVWYLDGHPFLPSHASRAGDHTAIHSWIFNGTAQHYGGMSTESLRHAEYLVELSAAFATDPARPVWLQEVGAPRNCLAEAETAAFCEQTVRHAADTANLWGVTWWCSHDVPRSLADFPELEHTLGLFREDGTPKPIAHRFAAIAAELRSRPDPPARRVAVEIPMSTDGVPIRTELAPGGGVFTTWMALARRGERPALVTPAEAGGVTVVQPATGGRSVYAAVSE